MTDTRNNSSPTTTPSQGKLWSKAFVLLTAMQTLDLLTYNMISPVIAQHATGLGFTIVMAGITAGAFAFAALFSRPLTGFLSDRFGRKRIVLCSVVVSCVCQAGYAFALTFPALVTLRCVHGFFYALFGTAVAALAMDTLPENRRSEGMGWFGTSYVLANVSGPALGIAMSDAFGFTPMFLLGAALAASTIVLGMALPQDAQHQNRGQEAEAARLGTLNQAPDDGKERDSMTGDHAGEPAIVRCDNRVTHGQAKEPAAATCDGRVACDSAEGSAAARRDDRTTHECAQESAATQRRGLLAVVDRFVSIKCLPLAFITCCYIIIWAIISTYIVMTADARGAAGISLFFVVNSITLFFTRPFAGKVSDKHGLVAVFVPSVFFEVLALLLIAFTGHPVLLIAAGALKALGSGTITPSLQAECGKLESTDRSGVAMSTYLLGTDIGYAVGPVIGAAVLGAYGYEALYLSGLPILSAGAVVFFAWFALHRNPNNTAN